MTKRFRWVVPVLLVEMMGSMGGMMGSGGGTMGEQPHHDMPREQK